MKTTVIYHSADFDGIFCREIARKFLPDAELIGWNFGDPTVAWERLNGRNIYVMDLPCDAPVGAKFPDDAAKTLNMKGCYYGAESLVWIDHHKSAIESHRKDAVTIPGYRIDGVAACRLAWQWFSATEAHEPVMNAPIKQDFIDRLVLEPLAVRLAGEYDIWDRRDPRAETFQYGLRVEPLTNGDWILLLGENSEGRTNVLIEHGKIAQSYQQKVDSDLVTYKSYRMKWEELDFIVLNTGRFNSLTFAALDKPETGHDALLGYMFNGKCWTVSLYHANHRKDLDLSLIAVKYGGGGHKGACGFTCKQLPFLV